MAADVTQRIAVALARNAQACGRPHVILDEDLVVADRLSGGRTASIAALRHLRAAGRLDHVRRGLDVLLDATGVARVDTEALIEAATPGPHLVTAGRALELHNLSDQRFREVVVLVSAPKRPFRWRGDHVKFVATDPARIWGSTVSHGVSLASPERALLDSLARRSWGVSLSQCVEALDRALGRWPAFETQLARSASRYRNAAVARRFGYLVEQLSGADRAVPFDALRGSSNAMTLLDPSGPGDGPLDRRWRLRVNIDLDAVLDHRTIS